MDIAQKQALLVYLSQYATVNKLAKMDTVLQSRTRHITLVLEDLFQPHNASAIVRSSECFGIQDIHIIEKRNAFKAHCGIAMGAAQWLDLHYYDGIQSCFDTLKAKGYVIAATTLHPNAIPLSELPLDKKVALVFGTELTGITDKAVEHADYFVTIPMCGFTQSLNVSVSTALCLYQLTEKLKKSSLDWRLSHDEQVDILLTWLRRVVPAAEPLEKRFLSEQK